MDQSESSNIKMDQSESSNVKMDQSESSNVKMDQSESNSVKMDQSEISKGLINQSEIVPTDDNQLQFSINSLQQSETYRNRTKIHYSNEEILSYENLAESRALANTEGFEENVRCLIKEYNEFHFVLR